MERKTEWNGRQNATDDRIEKMIANDEGEI